MKSYLEWVPGRWRLSRTEKEEEEIPQAGLSSLEQPSYFYVPCSASPQRTFTWCGL